MLNVFSLSWSSILLFLFLFLLHLIWPSFSAEIKTDQEFRKGNGAFKSTENRKFLKIRSHLKKNYCLQFYETVKLCHYIYKENRQKDSIVLMKVKRLGFFASLNSTCVKMKPWLEILSTSWENNKSLRPTWNLHPSKHIFSLKNSNITNLKYLTLFHKMGKAATKRKNEMSIQKTILISAWKRSFPRVKLLTKESRRFKHR